MTSCTRTTVPRSCRDLLVVIRKLAFAKASSRLIYRDSSILPEDMANQSVRIKEEQLRREEEKLREIELKVQREIQVKRQELLAKEDSLKVLEARLGSSHITDYDDILMCSITAYRCLIRLPDSRSSCRVRSL